MIKMNRNKVRPCDECLKINTFLCPNSSECFSTEDKPYFRNRMMLLKENKQLQNNWNELKKFVEEKMSVYEHKEASNFYVVFEKMQELQGDDKN